MANATSTHLHSYYKSYMGLPALPKNLTIRFGAHRASIYGASHAAKTAPFTTAAKDSVRESHDRDYIANPVHPKILDEEFPDFQKLLDDLEDEVPPITLPCLSPLTPLRPATHPASSRQKRRAEGDQADLAHTGASRQWGTNGQANGPQQGHP